jgi:hypothetical protein
MFMTRGLSPIETVIFNAQHFVAEWLRNPARRPFRESVESAIRFRYADTLTSDGEREAFRRVANAIRTGRGHASANPAPLLDIAEKILGP